MFETVSGSFTSKEVPRLRHDPLSGSARFPVPAIQCLKQDPRMTTSTHYPPCVEGTLRGTPVPDHHLRRLSWVPLVAGPQFSTFTELTYQPPAA